MKVFVRQVILPLTMDLVNHFEYKTEDQDYWDRISFPISNEIYDMSSHNGRTPLENFLSAKFGPLADYTIFETTHEFASKPEEPKQEPAKEEVEFAHPQTVGMDGVYMSKGGFTKREQIIVDLAAAYSSKIRFQNKDDMVVAAQQAVEYADILLHEMKARK